MSVRLRCYPGTTVDGRMSAEEYRESLRKAKKRKYGNQPTTVDGVRIDSKAEARRWAELQAENRSGKITCLRRQVAFELAPSVRLLGEKKAKPAMKIVVDFTYVRGAFLQVEDVKSPVTAKTAAFRMKQHLLKARYGLDIRIVK